MNFTFESQRFIFITRFQTLRGCRSFCFVVFYITYHLVITLFYEKSITTTNLKFIARTCPPTICGINVKCSRTIFDRVFSLRQLFINSLVGGELQVIINCNVEHVRCHPFIYITSGGTEVSSIVPFLQIQSTSNFRRKTHNVCK